MNKYNIDSPEQTLLTTLDHIFEQLLAEAPLLNILAKHKSTYEHLIGRILEIFQENYDTEIIKKLKVKMEQNDKKHKDELKKIEEKCLKTLKLKDIQVEEFCKRLKLDMQQQQLEQMKMIKQDKNKLEEVMHENEQLKKFKMEMKHELNQFISQSELMISELQQNLKNYQEIVHQKAQEIKKLKNEKMLQQKKLETLTIENLKEIDRVEKKVTASST